jgi:hypothetical protein
MMSVMRVIRSVRVMSMMRLVWVVLWMKDTQCNESDEGWGSEEVRRMSVMRVMRGLMVRGVSIMTMLVETW